MAQILAGLGFQTNEANNGYTALECLSTTSPEYDLVLIDWRMPIMDGLECIKAIRQGKKNHNIKIIMITSENESICIQDALEAGADEYIIKPFTQDILIKKLQILELLSEQY